MPDGLHWILLLPASLGAYFGIQVLVSHLPLAGLVWQILNSVPGPYAFVVAGAYTSPRRSRFVTSVALAAIFGVIMAVAVVRTSLFFGTLEWSVPLSGVVALVTVIVACIRIQRKEGSRDVLKVIVEQSPGPPEQISFRNRVGHFVRLFFYWTFRLLLWPMESAQLFGDNDEDGDNPPLTEGERSRIMLRGLGCVGAWILLSALVAVTFVLIAVTWFLVPWYYAPWPFNMLGLN